MRLSIKLAAYLALVAVTAMPAIGLADEDVIAVIVNKQNPVKVMSRTELRPIFQTAQTAWPDGKTILPLNLPETDSTRMGFDSAVLGLDPDRVARYWIDRKIRGGARPPTKAPNAAAVLLVVSKKVEAIGYVPVDKVTNDVKVVAKISSGQIVAP